MSMSQQPLTWARERVWVSYRQSLCQGFTALSVTNWSKWLPLLLSWKEAVLQLPRWNSTSFLRTKKWDWIKAETPSTHELLQTLATLVPVLHCFIKSRILGTLNSHDGLGFDVNLVVLWFFFFFSKDYKHEHFIFVLLLHLLPSVLFLLCSTDAYFSVALVLFFSQHLEKLTNQWGLDLSKRLCLLLQGLKVMGS